MVAGSVEEGGGLLAADAPGLGDEERQETILDRMLELGIIDEATCKAAKAEKLLFTDTDEYKAIHGLEPEVEEEDQDEEASALRKGS